MKVKKLKNQIEFLDWYKENFPEEYYKLFPEEREEEK